MGTKVFISWSGERSRQVGEFLKKWMKIVVQNLEPWMSTDIARGSVWFNEINDALEGSKTGIICLTKENINQPWILFEAGALKKGVDKNKVCLLLIDLVPEDLSDPLAQFNASMPDKDGMFKLLSTLNQSTDNPLTEDILQSAFSANWDYFVKSFNEIIQKTKEGNLPKQDINELLKEVLLSVRNSDKRTEQTAQVLNQLLHTINQCENGGGGVYYRQNGVFQEVDRENPIVLKDESIYSHTLHCNY